MWVVKIGGSLQSVTNLESLVSSLADHGAGKIILVPGGGVFADAVRQAQKKININNINAHHMALRAMEIFGYLLASLHPKLLAVDTTDEINSCLNEKMIPVWHPYKMISENPEIKASWDVTSDSLSLWLAHQLKIENLVLIKSILPANRCFKVSSLVQGGHIDNYFPELMNKKVTAWWLFYKNLNEFISILKGDLSLDHLELIRNN